MSVLKLKRPLKIGSEEKAELNFREPVAGDFWELEATGLTFGSLMTVAANVTGTPLKIMKTMCMEDMLACVQKVGEFIPDGLKTGDSPSA